MENTAKPLVQCALGKFSQSLVASNAVQHLNALPLFPRVGDEGNPADVALDVLLGFVDDIGHPDVSEVFKLAMRRMDWDGSMAKWGGVR